jgi:hypothetical protein
MSMGLSCKLRKGVFFLTFQPNCVWRHSRRFILPSKWSSFHIGNGFVDAMSADGLRQSTVPFRKSSFRQGKIPPLSSLYLMMWNLLHVTSGCCWAYALTMYRYFWTIYLDSFSVCVCGIYADCIDWLSKRTDTCCFEKQYLISLNIAGIHQSINSWIDVVFRACLLSLHVFL